MATMDRISTLYDEFRCAAYTELASCYELFDLQIESGNFIVVVPHKTASKRLHHWFDSISRQNDHLWEIKAVTALNLMLESGDFSFDIECGCQFIEY